MVSNPKISLPRHDDSSSEQVLIPLLLPTILYMEVTMTEKTKQSWTRKRGTAFITKVMERVYSGASISTGTFGDEYDTASISPLSVNELCAILGSM